MSLSTLLELSVSPSAKTVKKFVGDLTSHTERDSYEETRQTNKERATGLYETAVEYIKGLNIPRGVVVGYFPEKQNPSIVNGLPATGLCMLLESKFYLSRESGEVDIDSFITTGRYEVLKDQDKNPNAIHFKSDSKLDSAGPDFKDFFDRATIIISGDPKKVLQVFKDIKSALNQHLEKRVKEEETKRITKLDNRFYNVLIRLVAYPERLKELVVKHALEAQINLEDSYSENTHRLVTKKLIAAGVLIKEKNIDKWTVGTRVYDKERREVGRYYPTYSTEGLKGGYVKYWMTKEKVLIDDPLKSNLLLVNPSLRGKEFRRILKEVRTSYIDTFTSLAAKALKKKIEKAKLVFYFDLDRKN